jgi:CRP-like cAMP-binding protein
MFARERIAGTSQVVFATKFADTSVRNKLLADLPAEEMSVISPHLHHVVLRRSEPLVERAKPITDLYFLDEGWASVVAMSAVRPVEVAMVGAEGMVGVSYVFGTKTAALNCVMQAPGRAHRIYAERFMLILRRMPCLKERVDTYVFQRLLQLCDGLVAATVGTLEARVARAILMCHDRGIGDEITITQDQLARKVGANRSGITNALHFLEGEKAILSQRRRIVVRSRSSLEQAASGTYKVKGVRVRDER